MNLKERIEFIVKFCGAYLGHSNMVDERHQEISFNICLPEEDEIISCIKKVSVILLTGEAGDGKSRMIRNLAQLFDDNGFEIIPDFSALSEPQREKIVKNIDAYYSVGSGISPKYVIAANIGIFTQTFLKYSGKELDDIGALNTVKIINFQKRNLAELKESESGVLFYRIIELFTEYEGDCCQNDCLLSRDCPFKRNIDALKERNVVENIRVLCDSLYLTGGHLTFRELLSLIAFMITGGEDCVSISGTNRKESIEYFNIFDIQDDILLKKFSIMDPSRKSMEDDSKRYIDCYNDLRRFVEEKRKHYFKEKHENPYDLLPISYLSEFKKAIDELQSYPYYKIAIESTDIFAEIKKGLIRLISPQETDLEISFFDTPLKISRNIKTKYSIDINRINLIWNRYDFDYNTTTRLKEKSNNSFCLSCIMSKGEYVSLPIDYNLFKYILAAKDGIYVNGNYEIMEEFGLSNFFRKVLEKNSDAYRKMSVLFDDKDDSIVDFEMTKYEQKLLFDPSPEEKVLIKKVTGGAK